jgi:hypothetical protein
MEFNRVQNSLEVKLQKTNLEKLNFTLCAAAPIVVKTST